MAIFCLFEQGAYLQYFYQTDYYGFYFKNKGFPDLSPHKCPPGEKKNPFYGITYYTTKLIISIRYDMIFICFPGTLGQYPNCFTLTTIRPQTGDVDIEGHVLKTLIG